MNFMSVPLPLVSLARASLFNPVPPTLAEGCSEWDPFQDRWQSGDVDWCPAPYRRRRRGGFMSDLPLHAKYLPFTSDQLRDHFAPVAGKALDDRHLRYFTDSLLRLAAHLDGADKGKPSKSDVRIGRQLEKDERFWIVTALMNLYHRPRGEAARAQAFGDLLQLAGLRPPKPFSDWVTALDGSLELYFEVNLPSPTGYRTWLRNHLDERVLIPYVREAADKATRLEGTTKVDAMLLAPDTGVAVIFEAKVLSDVSTQVTFDVARNQLARNIDVMLDPPSTTFPLNKRQPSLTSFVLLTPDVFRQPGTGLRSGRLYGWLMDAYQDPSKALLAEHLGHRTAEELVGVANRLGWASWEDVNEVIPGACSWLPV